MSGVFVVRGICDGTVLPHLYGGQHPKIVPLPPEPIGSSPRGVRLIFSHWSCPFFEQHEKVGFGGKPGAGSEQAEGTSGSCVMGVFSFPESQR